MCRQLLLAPTPQSALRLTAPLAQGSLWVRMLCILCVMQQAYLIRMFAVPRRIWYPGGDCMDWKELALRRVGCGSPEQVQRKYGLPETGRWDLETCRLLWSRLAGYVWHRLEPG